MNSFLSPLLISLQVASIAGLIAMVLGTFTAYFMSNREFKGKFALEILFLLPVVLPPSVIGFLILVVLGTSSPLYPIIMSIFNHSLIFTKSAAVIAATIVAFPIMYQSAKIAFSQIDEDVISAAIMDQASEKQRFFEIILPLAKNALISGGILTFARAFGEFGATLMVAGNIAGKTQTLPIAIYSAMAVNDMALASKYVLIMISISILFLYLTRKLAAKEA